MWLAYRKYIVETLPFVTLEDIRKTQSYISLKVFLCTKWEIATMKERFEPALLMPASYYRCVFNHSDTKIHIYVYKHRERKRGVRQNFTQHLNFVTFVLHLSDKVWPTEKDSMTATVQGNWTCSTKWKNISLTLFKNI